MSNLTKSILSIVKQSKWDDMRLYYRQRRVKFPDNIPQLLKTFKECGLTEDHYIKVVALLGDKQKIHDYLGAESDLEIDKMDEILDLALEEAKNRLQDITNKDLLLLVRAIIDAKQKPGPDTQITFDMGSFLERGAVNVIENE